MEPRIYVTLILCTYGFLKELRPSEPFVTEYIVEHKNITVEEVIHVAFPVSTYASLISLAIILLVTDIVRYKPVVIVEGACHVLAWGILIFAKDLKAVIIVEIIYGIASSAELAYSTYIYAQVDKDYYSKVTSHTKSASQAGKFAGGLIAQVLVSFSLLNYHQLNYVTLACVSLGLGFTLILPRVKTNRKYYFGAPQKRNELTPDCNDRKKCWSNFFEKFLYDLKAAYSNMYILKWSLWWAIASAGQYQVINYIQALWEKIREEGDDVQPLYNGAVKACHTLLSALLSFGIGYVTISWRKWGEIVLTLISIVQGIMLILMSQTDNLNIAYIAYIIFRTIHPVMMTAASAEIAQGIQKDSYALILGLNTFIALAIQTILTIVVADMKGLALDERTQYLVYGWGFITLGVIIGAATFYTLCTHIFTPRPNTSVTVQFSSVPQMPQDDFILQRSEETPLKNDVS